MVGDGLGLSSLDEPTGWASLMSPSGRRTGSPAWAKTRVCQRPRTQLRRTGNALDKRRPGRRARAWRGRDSRPSVPGTGEVVSAPPRNRRLPASPRQSLPRLQGTDDAKELAHRVLASGHLPATADRDATHIALASAYEMDMLLTWNRRHIANATIPRRMRKPVEAAGFNLPVICTPEELIESEHEQDD